MQYDIRYGPSYALGIIYLEAGEPIQAETGAMVSMADTIKMQTGMRGGIMAGLRRSVLGGESFFINTFTAEAPGELTVAPALPGDIIAVEMGGQALLVQSGSFLAVTPGINVDTKWGGGRSFFSSEGFSLPRCTGTGVIFLSSYGAIHRVDLAPGQRQVVNTGHMVAFDESVGYEVGRAGGWKTTIAGGEGLVVRAQGPGRFFLQTRNPRSFIDWIIPKLPSRRE